MNIIAKDLLQDLIERTQGNINKAETFKQLSFDTLTWRKDSDSWSILECIEHLNRYGAFYIPEIKNRIKSSKHSNSKRFVSGWLGNYAANMMLPKEKLNTMKTFKSMNPIDSNLSVETIDIFIEQQYSLIDLLEKSKKVNLNKVKTAISISKWIKLRLGDTFRVVIYHNQRHILQGERIVLKKNT